MNEKSQVTQERLYFEERKRGRALGITKELTGQQKSIEKPKQQRILRKQLKTPSQGKIDSTGDRLAILAASPHLPQALDLAWGFVQQ
jgi:hypothetical protein